MEEYGSAGPDCRFENLSRDGTVVARRFGQYGPEVQVTFPDRDGVTTDWLPVKVPGSAGCNFFYCPRVGDNVTVQHYPTGIESGVVVGGHNTSNNPCFPPHSLNSIAMQPDDGSMFEYDPDVGCLVVNGIGTLYFNALGQAIFICGGDLDVTVGGNLNATVTGNVIITAPNISLNGNVEITGTLSTTGSVAFGAGGTIQTHLQNLDGAGGGS
ncbi:MAG: phage baseplate assembly protein V [Terriglobales bacterium]|jgi:phage baseplate assembly protein V